MNKAHKTLRTRFLSVILTLGLIMSFWSGLGNMPSMAKTVTNNAGTFTWQGDQIGEEVHNLYIASGTVNGDITIPSTIDGMPVKSIGTSVSAGDSLISSNCSLPAGKISIDARNTSITKVNDNVLCEQVRVGSLYLPDTVTYIGDRVCTSAGQNIYCDNANITFKSSSDDTFPNFAFHGASKSTALDHYGADKYDGSGPTTLKVYLDGSPYYLYTNSDSYGRLNTLTPPQKSGATFLGYYFGVVPIYQENGTVNATNIKKYVSSLSEQSLVSKYFVPITYHAEDTDVVGGSFTERAIVGENYTVSSTAPNRSGNIFQGWSLTKGGNVSYISGSTISNVSHSMDLYASFTARTYLIRFDGNGGENAPSPVQMTYERLSKGEFPSVSNPSRAAHHFIGWSADPEGKQKVETSADILKYANNYSLTLYAQWGRDTLDINYYIDGVVTHTQKVEIGKKNKLWSPQIEGKTFNGWSRDAVATDVHFSPNTEYSEFGAVGNLNLYAVLKKHTYKIVFKPYDTMDKGSMDSIDAVYGETVPLFTNCFTRQGYKFAGWSTRQIIPTTGESVAAEFIDGAKVKNLTNEDGGIVTLYPVWVSKVNMITYDTNSGDDAISYNTTVKTSYCYGETVPLPIPIREGYVFVGWQDESGNTVTAISATDTGDKKFKAIWKERGVTIQFMNASVTDATLDGAVIRQSGYDMPTNDFPKGKTVSTLVLTISQGLSFTNLRVTDSKNNLITDKATLSGDTVTVNLNNHVLSDDLHVYVYGEPKVYQITYELDGGTFSGEYDKTYTFGVAKDLPKNVVKDGYQFFGWMMENGKIVTAIPEGTVGDIKLVAKFSKGSYNSVVDLSGGHTADERFVNGKATFDFQFNSGTIDLPSDVEKEGYDFLGWYDESTYSYVDCIDTSFPTDHIIYAMFTANASVGFISNVIRCGESQEKVIVTERESDKGGYYYYKQLNDYEKNIYQVLLKTYEFDMSSGQINNQITEMASSEELDREVVLNVCAALCKDHPELFWIRYFSCSEPETDNRGIYRVFVQPNLAYAEEVVASDVLEYQAYFEQITSYLDANDVAKMNTQQKVETVNSYICKHFSYRNYTNILGAKTSNETRSVGYFLSSKEGCCEAYAKLTMLLLRHYGVEAIVVTSSDHAWNEIKIGDTWYTHDTTWNDGGSKSNEKYVLRGGKLTDKHHQIRNYFYLEAEKGEAKNEDSTSQTVFQPVTSYGQFETPPLASMDCGKIVKSGLWFRYLGGKMNVIKISSEKTTYTVPKTVFFNEKSYRVTVIKKGVFKGKDIRKLILYPTIKTIEKGAFQNMSKKLKLIIKGNASQKKRLTKLVKESGLKKFC